MYDYEDEAPTTNQMAKLMEMTSELLNLDARVEAITGELESLRALARTYREELIPGLMNEVGVSDLTTSGGARLTLKTEVRASLPKDPERRAAAFEYLRSTGDDGLIKREVKLKFDRDAAAKADEVAALLRSQNLPARIDVDYSIHPQTLLAYLRRQLDENKDIPLDAFGGFLQTFVKVTK